jgi:hypothetical protein
MKGAGYYDEHSAAQMSSIHAFKAWIEEAVASLPLPAAEQPVTMLDLGSSEGRNAIGMMANIVERFRRRTGQPLRPTFSDLPSNNFNQLFANLDEAQRGGALGPDVFPTAVGGSFYRPLLPPQTVHLATSFNAIQWLDQLPAVPVPDHVAYLRSHLSRPGVAPSQEVTAAFQRQAEHDLVRFLECRAAELVPGGKLLVAGPGDSDKGLVSEGLLDVLNDACLDLVAVGRMEREEYERVTMPCYFRTVDELLAAVERPDSPLSRAFKVDRAIALEIPAPFFVEFRRSGDVAAYAGAFTGFLRAVSEPVVTTALRPASRTDLVVDSLYERVRARLLADPERYLWRYVVTAMLLTRR